MAAYSKLDGKMEGSPEKQFVLDTIGCFVKHTRPLNGIPENLDKSWLNNLIAHYNLGPVFNWMYGCAETADAFCEEWRHKRVETLRKNILTLKAAVKVFNVLYECGIPSVSLRGLNLANRFYPSPELRPMRDVDILVDAGAKTIETAFEKYGYTLDRRLKTQLVYSIDNTVFEIHLSFLTTKRYRKQLDTDYFLDHTTVMNLPEGKIPVLTADAELVSVVSHAFIHHEIDRLMPLIDTGLLMTHPKTDIASAAAWCSEKGLAELLHFTMSFVNEIFGLNAEETLEHFNVKSQKELNKVYEAYLSWIWGIDTLSARLLRKKNLFYTTESMGGKLKQLIRFTSPGEIKPAIKLLAKKRMHRLGGVEKK